MKRGDNTFAVFDIDGTVVRNFSFGAEFIYKIVQTYGLPKDKELSNIAMQKWHKAEQHKQQNIFDTSLRPYYRQYLPNLTKPQIELAGNEVSEMSLKYITPAMRDLIIKHKQQGLKLFAVSYSPEITLIKLLKQLGFDDWWAPQMLFDSSNHYLPRSKDNQIIWDKKQHLLDLCDKHKLTLKGSYGYGDNINDKPMLDIVENPIAINPDRLLYKEATKRGWYIINAS
ncbi:MAG: HAD-IB family phosphatase [Patescibacteria group bacterium]|jgi:HAD superfamily phosphoserine phosphatase-like hydrolase|nr:HAD-IB family phosphatase [Patescibacteria group bacterium]